MDNNVWDDIFVNTHQKSFREGREEGRKQGSLAGLQDGKAVGLSKGVEFGLELGFLRGICEIIEESTDNAKMKRKATDLLALIRSFPSPESIFQEPPSTDLREQIQRIRAKFMILTSQHRQHQLSLKQVLSDTGTTIEDQQDDMNW
mmetsp:Transcript_42/g.94  ORF Transcript_42/g.94 Transcript_42/m.94 type:complete len:146 (-) Transcript_42:1311-1748(-)